MVIVKINKVYNKKGTTKLISMSISYTCTKTDFQQIMYSNKYIYSVILKFTVKLF